MSISSYTLWQWLYVIAIVLLFCLNPNVEISPYPLTQAQPISALHVKKTISGHNVEVLKFKGSGHYW